MPGRPSSNAAIKANGAASVNRGQRRNAGSASGDTSTNHRYCRRYQIRLSDGPARPYSGGAGKGATPKKSFPSGPIPAPIMKGTAMLATNQTGGKITGGPRATPPP